MYHDCQKTDAKDSNNTDTFDGSIFEDSLDNYVVNIFRSIYTDSYDYYVVNIIIQIINAFPRSHENTSIPLMPKFYMEMQILLSTIIDNNSCDSVI